MTLTDKEREWLDKNTMSFDDHLMSNLQDPEYRKGWLQLTLEDFLKDGNCDTFIRCLTYVVKAQVKEAGRGEISRLARELKIDRSNLSEIVNGTKQPRLETAFKLLNGLGYEYDIKLKRAQ